MNRMNLNNFEQSINKVILGRGWDYYESGRIESLEFEDGEWLAEVSGGEDYCVSVLLSENGEILRSYCDCPYEFGEYCKHQAAVFYALKNLPKQEMECQKIQKTDIRSLLSAQSKETLIAILAEFAKNDRQIRNDLLLRFSDADNLTDKARNLIKSSVKKAMHGGFVEYGCTDQAIEGAEKVLEMAGDMAQDLSLASRVEMLIVVLEEMMELLEDCDDSDGEVGGIIEEAIQGIDSVISKLDKSFGDKPEIFDLITDHALSSQYEGWSSWQLDMLGACVPLCGDALLRKRLESCLADFFTDTYDKKHAQRIQAQIIADFDGENAADAYRAQNLDNSDFRRLLIEKTVSQGQLESALELCLKGEKLDAGYPGLVKQWQEIRYSIHERMDDMPTQINLARTFVLDGNFDYYAKLKLLYSSAEWPSVLEDLLAEFDERSDRVYVKILIEEGLKQLLLAYCRQKPWSLPGLYRHLIPDYADEISPLFEKLIRLEAGRASDRKGYRTVCGIIQNYMHACGESATRVLITDLFVTYKKRPAFVDELKKVI